MELFDENGCLTDEGLQALTGGRLEETERLEAAEHLAYCDRCMDRYTALLTEDALEAPPRPVRGTVMAAIWVRLMQNTWGRAAVAGVAAVLALTMWRSGALGHLADLPPLHSQQPTVSHSRMEDPQPLGRSVPDDDRSCAGPETLGRPVEDTRPENKISLADALNGLLFGGPEHNQDH